MAKVFVTGAAGYIGEGVALAFRRHGYRVYGLVRSAEQARSLRQKEITAVIGKQDDPSSYKHILAECAIVVDAIGHNAFSQKFVELVVDAHASRVKAHPSYKPLLIFTSGIMTYGNASKLPVDETVIPRPIFQDQGRPDSMQDRKAFEEWLLLQTQQLHPVVFRPGFVYGGHGGVIAHMFWGIDLNADLVLYGRADKRWSWVHVDDLGEAYALAASKGAAISGQLFNVAAERDNPTYEELRSATARLAGWKGGKILKDVGIPPEEERVKNWEADVIINPRKAIEVLGWRPKHEGFLAELEIIYDSYTAAREARQ